LPPAELAVHPATEGDWAELHLMTDDVAATGAALQAQGVEIARPISDQGWGLLTAILPGGVGLGLYQPQHPTAAAELSSIHPRSGFARVWTAEAGSPRPSSRKLGA
jgi:hypothetical protein